MILIERHSLHGRRNELLNLHEGRDGLMVFDKCFIFKEKMQRSQLIRLLLVFCFTVQTFSAEAPAATTGEVLRGAPGGPAHVELVYS